MKIKRQKTVKRLIAFYRNNFNINPPYQVLIDGTFCRAALKFKINIGEQMPKYLAGEVELMTTACALRECELLGTLLYGPLKLLRQYRLVSCKHAKCPGGAVSAAECLLSLARKLNSHYMFATQDRQLSERLRAMPGRPLLYIAYNAIHLEAPASVSQSVADSTTAAKLEVNNKQQEALVNVAKAMPQSEELLAVLPNKEENAPKEEIKPRKRRGPKGPNPLSCKKTKKKAGTMTSKAHGSVENQQKKKKTKRRKQKKNAETGESA